MIVQAPKTSEYTRLSFTTGAYSWGKVRTGDVTAIAQLAIVSPGGIAVAPTGALSVVPAGQPRIIPGYGLLAEPSATNILSGLNNIAPVDASGWTLLNSRPAGATITVVDDTAALQAAGLFADLLAKGVMTGKVIRLYNPSSTTEFAIPMFDASGGKYGFSAYVRCLSGGGYMTVTGGGGQSDTFTNTAWARVGRVHNVGTQGRIMVKPLSEILVILPQAEVDRITSPIIVTGSPVTRVADVPGITSPILGKPHTIVIEGEMALQNGVERTLFELANADGAGFVVSRTTDGALTANLRGGYKKPCVPRLIGPGRFRIAHRVGIMGHSIAGAGISAHAPYVSVPAGLKTLTIGSRRDGSLPFTGWIREIRIITEVSRDQLETIVASPADAFLPETRRYVSPTGSDTNDGRTPQTPWKTMANVRDPLQFWPGTHFYFERGGSWAETLLPTNRCTYRAYGAGAKPRIGQGQQYALDENGASDFRVTELHFFGAKSRGINCYGASGVMIDGNEISGNGSLTDNNAIAVAIRGNTRKAECELVSKPADVVVSAFATTESALTGEYAVTCMVGGSGSATRWQVKRPDGTLVTGTAIGGTAFTSLDISFTISGSAAVGDVVKIRSKPFSEIAFPTSALAEDVWIENNYVHDNVGKAAGDAVYVEGVGGICAVIGNLIPPPLGTNADCIQVGRNSSLYVANPAHAIIRDNQVAAYTGGGKGAIVVLTESCLIEGNVVRGNNFCIGFNAITKAVVRWNTCYDSGLKDYSWGIGIGTEFDSANVEIYGNVIRDCVRGITLSGITTSTLTQPGRVPRSQSRSKIIVRDNIIERCSTGFFIDRPTSGLIENNTMRTVTNAFDVRATTGPQGEPLVTIINNTVA